MNGLKQLVTRIFEANPVDKIFKIIIKNFDKHNNHIYKHLIILEKHTKKLDKYLDISEKHTKNLDEHISLLNHHLKSLNESLDMYSLYIKDLIKYSKIFNNYTKKLDFYLKSLKKLREEFFQNNKLLNENNKRLAEFSVQVPQTLKLIIKSIKLPNLKDYRIELNSKFKITFERVEKYTYVDKEGKYFKKDYPIELYLFSEKEKLYIIDYKYHLDSDLVNIINEKFNSFEKINEKKVEKRIIVCMKITKSALDYCKKLGIETIYDIIEE